MSSPGYFGPQRTNDEIVLYLSPNQPPPEVPPIELQSHIPNDVWTVRIHTITRVAARFSKIIFERAWFLLAVVSTIAAPLAVYPILVKFFRDKKEEDKRNNRSTGESLFEARGISFAIFVGLIILFYVPIGVWKYIGRKHANSLLRGWAKEDAAAKPPGASLPFWKVKTPGVFNSDIILTITIPADQPPSSFHPDAYLPSYINGPADSDAEAYRGQAAEVYGKLPLYTDTKHPQQKPITDEKNPFEDVKV